MQHNNTLQFHWYNINIVKVMLKFSPCQAIRLLQSCFVFIWTQAVPPVQLELAKELLLALHAPEKQRKHPQFSFENWQNLKPSKKNLKQNQDSPKACSTSRVICLYHQHEWNWLVSKVESPEISNKSGLIHIHKLCIYYYLKLFVKSCRFCLS